ncbi:hypothetical protein IPZ60_12850 [Psychrobacter sp. NG25]|uniref:hypothetical protein n=1 Tax=Psychrobacter sp. NG25 TaxID=2782005 RepID=UPI0018833FD7|nr:hypothetical protein [Psychrobacter sp. NG25]MBF0659632.1 hypothetical protein [Psychrobacter sp. NG25]
MECSAEDYENEEFENIFIKIICNSLDKSFRECKNNRFNVIDFLIISKLKENNLDFDYEDFLLIEGVELIIDRVSFPSNYKISKKVEDIIKNIYSVKWNFCNITFDITKYIERSEFNECCFTKDIFLQKSIPSINVKPYHENFIFFECVFEKDVTIGWETIGRLEIYKGLFLDCVFINNLKLFNTSFKFPFFSNSEFYSNTEYDDLCVYPIRYIKIIVIENCIFDSNFSINGIDLEKSTDKVNVKNYLSNLKSSMFIEDLCIKNSKFNKKFELKYSSVKNIDFDNSNVDGIFDVYKSSFIKAKFRKSIFKEFAAFEYVVFGDGKKENITDFIYTTFKDFSNFRNTKFKSGLNFSSANIKQEPNFLNTNINLVGTDRETLRIIKNSFEKNNKKIEASRFFTYEMREYRKETKWIKNPFRRFVLNANYVISGFGNNYVWPILILCASVALYVHLLIHQNEWVIKTLNLVNIIGGDRAVSWFDTVTYYANEGSKVIIPFNKLLEAKQGFEFISLLFFIWFGVLIWQTVVAVKRNTQH